MGTYMICSKCDRNSVQILSSFLGITPASPADWCDICQETTFWTECSSDKHDMLNRFDSYISTY